MEDENKNYKNYGRIALWVIGAIVLIAGAWFLFSQPTTSRTNSERVESGFDNTDREQQEAKRDIDAIETGLADGQRSLDSITASTERSQGTASAIASTDARASARIEESERSVERITGGLDRITARDSATLSELQKQKQETQTLNLKWGELQSYADRANSSITKANESLQNTRLEFQKNEKAHEKTEKSLKNRITAWQIIAGLLAGYAISK